MVLLSLGIGRGDKTIILKCNGLNLSLIDFVEIQMLDLLIFKDFGV